MGWLLKFLPASKQAVVLTVSSSSSSLAFPYQKEGRIYSWQKSLLQTHKSFWTLRENVDSERHLLLWNEKHQIRHSLSWKGFERMANIDYQVYWCICYCINAIYFLHALFSKHDHNFTKKRVQLIYGLCNQSIILKYMTFLADKKICKCNIISSTNLYASLWFGLCNQVASNQTWQMAHW